ncbi:testis-specific serine/threonine-protein kinase 3 [Dermatophagoides farinae]|uniref:testis-specific serine/threonine-protein kinase 3 n=1 Tax=Dermatophagoides farinae TaxID=6954 RepID=UPI003F60CFB5
MVDNQQQQQQQQQRQQQRQTSSSININHCQQIMKHGYRINNLIGTGSYACVYKAQQIRFNRMVAIKFINFNQCSDYYRKNFLRYEIHIIRMLNNKPHVNIIDFIEAFNIDQPPTINGYVIVMEFIENGTLRDRILEKGRQSERRSRLLFRSICNGLLHMHENQIAHRDVKLDNILLTIDDQPKICDFSLSILWTNNNDRKKLCEDYCGTELYLPPEIYRKIPYNPMAYDVWNCGVCLYIVTSGMFPFHSDDEQLVVQHQLNHNYRQQSQYQRLSTNLKQLINSMLEPDFNKRLNINEVLYSKWFNSISDNNSINIQQRTISRNSNNNRRQSLFQSISKKNKFSTLNINKKR